ALQNEADDAWIKILSKFEPLLRKKFSRAFLRDQIIQVQKNISGTSKENIQKLYEKLGLKQDAIRKLRKFSRWYKKAEGIQELSVMNQRDSLRSIFKFVNHKNEFIRIEAQLAAINFLGFHGLRFLNIISYPLSEWQQLKLLEQLSHQPLQGLEGVTKWLQSTNDSVIVFALKLVRVYRRFDLYDAVTVCLNNPKTEVRKNAIITLMHIYSEDTTNQLIEHYNQEDKDCRLAILQSLNEIRDPETVPFLIEQLHDNNNEIKLAAARAIMSAANGQGINLLNTFAYAQTYPWSDIIRQLKKEAEA
ncbi:MAG: HEAT repeat domain-containing protein, partial [Chitinophagaceae bacterium]